MNPADFDAEHIKLPSFGVALFFSKKFTNAAFEYGIDRWGVCRYPLDDNGQRIIENLPSCPHTLGMYGGVVDKSETVAMITAYKGDTPHSLYFKFSPEITDVYSEHFDDSASENIELFINRLNQHLELINQCNTSAPFQNFNRVDFSVTFSFKYDHIDETVSKTALILFRKKGQEPLKCYITNNKLTTQASMRKMDMEFFNLYYKHKIQEAMPDASFDQIRELIDLSKWNENLKMLVKMAHY